MKLVHFCYFSISVESLISELSSDISINDLESLDSSSESGSSDDDEYISKVIKSRSKCSSSSSIMTPIEEMVLEIPVLSAKTPKEIEGILVEAVVHHDEYEEFDKSVNLSNQITRKSQTSILTKSESKALDQSKSGESKSSNVQNISQNRKLISLQNDYDKPDLKTGTARTLSGPDKITANSQLLPETDRTGAGQSMLGSDRAQMSSTRLSNRRIRNRGKTNPNKPVVEPEPETEPEDFDFQISKLSQPDQENTDYESEGEYRNTDESDPEIPIIPKLNLENESDLESKYYSSHESGRLQPKHGPDRPNLPKRTESSQEITSPISSPPPLPAVDYPTSEN
jgi:hypothetical protein